MKTLLERFNSKYSVCPNTGCWWWTAYRNEQGYGQIARGAPQKGMVSAHRVSYELFIGYIPEGLWCLHTCNQGHLGCVAPHHLKLGTHSENMRDMVLAGTGKGERSHMSKLTDELVREIRASTESGADIAKRLGVSRQAICLVRNGKTWSHIA